MQALRRFALLAVTTSPLLLLAIDAPADDRATTRFQSSGRMPVEETAAVTQADFFTEAPTGFDNRTNGLPAAGTGVRHARRGHRGAGPLVQRQPLHLRRGRERSRTDSGPTYNAQSCAECHQNVVTGGASQIAEHRTGTSGCVRRLLRIARRLADPFARDEPGRSSSASRSRTTFARSASRPTRLATASSNAIANDTLLAIRDAQPADIRGTAVMVPVLEGRQRDAHRPLRLEEPAREPRIVLGRRVSERDGHHQSAVPGREHVARPHRRLRHGLRSGAGARGRRRGREAFANFMRSTKAPSRGPITHGRQAGEALFNQVGCNGCHVVDIAHGARRDGDQRRRVPRSRPRWGTRSFIPTATSCCMTSAPATAFRCCRGPSTRQPRI